MSRRKKRRRHRLIELLEVRHLLAIDMAYPSDPLDSLITDLTLHVTSGGATPTLELFETGSPGNQLGQIQLTGAGDIDINIGRTPEAARSAAGDTLRIDLSTFGLLDTFVGANGGTLNLNFIGGDDIPIVSDDDVRIEGGGAFAIGYSFNLISSDQVDIATGTATITGDFNIDSDQAVTMTSGSITATNISLQSTPDTTGTPNADDLTEIIALPTASVSMVGGSLSAGNITFSAIATTNLTVSTTDLLDGALSVGGVVVVSDASIDISGAADIDATGMIDLNATSNVSASIIRGTEDDGDTSDDDKQEDAAISISTVTSDAAIRIAGNATLDSGGTIDADSLNTVVVNTTADGQLGSSSAGGTLATSVVIGDTTITVENTPIVTAGGNLSLDAISSRTVNTHSIATSDGATEDGDAGTQTQGQQSLSDNDAQTSDGSLDLAAAISVATVTGDVVTTIDGGTLRSTAAAVHIGSQSTQMVDTNADATTASGSGGTGVGIGVAIAVIDVDSKSQLTGAATLEGATGIDVSAIMPASVHDTEAKSGPSGDDSGADVGVAGALAMHVAITDVAATIGPAAIINTSGDDLQLTASSTTDNVATAKPLETPMGESLGVGASVAIHIPDQITRAAIENGATLTNVNHLTLSAMSDYDLTTEATSAAAGGTAIAAVVSNLVAHEDTLVQIGTGTLLTVGGNLTMTADHRGDVMTKAQGDAEGASNAAIGAAIALSIVNQRTEATIARSVTVGGVLSLSATEEGKNDAQATATAQGADGKSSDSSNVNDKTGSQRTGTDTTATGKGARDSSDSSSNPDASTDEGSVSVAAAVSINVVDVVTRSTLIGAITINVTGNASISTQSNSDAAATASGAAADASSAGVGAAVAINRVTITNEATLPTGVTIIAAGLALQATMKTVAADRKHRLAAEAVSGAGDGDVGVAASVSINLVDTTTRAVIPTGANVTLSGGDLTIAAEGNVESISTATPEDEGGTGTEVGVGASMALNRIDNIVTAEIQNSAVMGGTVGNLTISADGEYTTTTTAENGAAGDVAVGAAVAISLPDNNLTARLGSGNAITATGSLDISSTLKHTANVTASGDAAGGNVGVGASVAIGVVEDDSQAILARNVTAGAAASVTSTMDIDSQANAKATAGGNDSSGDDADTEANNKTNNNPNNGGNKTLPSANSETNNADSQSTSESSTGSSSVGVAAAIAVNFVTATSQARVESNVSLIAGGQTTVESSAEVDSSAKATGTAVQLSDSNNIGAAVGINRGNVTNQAFVGNNATVTGGGVRVAAITTGSETHDMVAWGAAAGGGTGDVGVAGSVGVNIVDVLTEAILQPGSQVTSTAAMDTIAESDVNPQTLAGAVGVSTGTSVGGAVAVTTMDIDTRAIIDGDADAAGVMTIDASTQVQKTKFDLPLLGPSDDPVATTVAVAGGLSSGDVGVAGAVVVSIYAVDTVAEISAGSMINQDPAITPAPTQSVNVSASTDVATFSLAGSLGVSLGAVGVGAGLDLGIYTLNTTARIGNGASVDADDHLTVNADLNEDYTGLSTNAGVGNTVGVAGSAAIYVINNNTQAVVGNATLDAGGNITITADGHMDMVIVGGSLAFGSTAGIGAANVTVTHSDSVIARIGDNANVTTHGATGLTIAADSSETIVSTAAAGAGASTAAVAGSAGVLILNETTQAWVGRSATIDANNSAASGAPSLKITADDATMIVSVAGSLAASGTAAVGLGADVATITKTTEAYIESGVVADVEGNVQVLANSSEDITSVAAGLSASAGVSVAIDAGVHVMNLTTRAFVGDDPTDGTPSAGPGNIDVRGSMNVAADDRTEIDKVVGVLAVAAYAGIGAAAGVSTVDKTTEAFVGAGADVNVQGQTPLTAKTGEIQISYTGASISTPGIEANGDVSVDSDAGTLSAQGEVGLADLDSMDVDQKGGNDANDQSLTSQRVANTPTTSIRGLAITATNRDDIETYTISLAGGIVGVAISAGVNVINTNTNSYVGSGATINDSTTGANAAQDVIVASGNDFYHFALAGTLAAGVVGVAPAVGVTVLSNTTVAEIRDGATVNAIDDVNVKAGASEDILLVGFGLAGGLVGIGGSVDVLSIDNTTQALVGAATVSVGGDVLVRAIDDTDLDVISGGVGRGFVGIGASVGVVTVDKVTQAIIGNGASVDARGLGTVTTGVFNGEQIGDGNSFATGNVNGVIVQADSSENYKHLAVAAGV
ncbi:MAG: hypothetical protein KDB00_13160, partial [Planctomycetales bacterium]|nr:hypothetical protein [Planctomycetales bacterium]